MKSSQPTDIVYCADVMHGGVAVLLCAVDTIVERLIKNTETWPGYKTVLELDGYTFEDWLRDPKPVVQALSRAIKDGRAELVSGAYTQPFAENIALESNIRQLQWGKMLCRKALDVDIETYLIQEHAYHIALPQILKQLGYKYLVLRTHWPIWGQHLNYPHESFLWEGSDGSQILTIPAYRFIYFGRVPNEPPGLHAWIQRRGAPEGGWPLEEADIQRWLDAARAEGIARPLASREPDLIAPQILADETIRKINEDPRTQFVTIAEYARLVEPSVQETLHLSADDMDTTLSFGLLGDVIYIGCKRAENLLMSAEKLSTAAYLVAGREVCNPDHMNLGGGQNAEDDLAYAWRKLMLAEQHDVWVCGPASTFGYSLADRGMNWLREAEAIGQEVVQESMAQILGAVGWKLPTPDALPILVCNSLSWPRTAIAKVEITFNKGEHRAVSILDHGGRPVTSQIVEQQTYSDGSLRKVVIAFVAQDMPSMGYRLYYAVGSRQQPGTTDLRASASRVSNAFFEATLSAHGLTSLVCQGSEGQALPLIPDGQVAAYLKAFLGDQGQWLDTRDGQAEIELVDNGPVYARYRLRGHTSAFDYTRLITVYCSTPWVEIEDTLDFPEAVYLGHYTPRSVKSERRDAEGGWHTDCFIEKEKLQVALPLNLDGARVSRNVVYVPTETQRDDFSAYDWADVSDGEKGLALVNLGNYRYHYDRSAQELSLVLGYSGAFLYTTTPDFHLMEGRYQFRYAIAPHGPRDFVWNNRRAWEINNPLFTLGTYRWRSSGRDIKKGSLAPEGSFLTLDAASGIVSTLMLEKGRPIIRLYEDAGRKGQARLTFDRPVAKAERVDLLGNVQQVLPVDQGALEVMLEPYQIVTLKFDYAS